jgi:hypothetical protein
MNEFESTRDEKPPTSQTSVVYDPRNGRIVYVHEFIGDGTGLFGPKGEEERARIALEGVKRHRKDAGRLRVLHVPRNFRFDDRTLYCVDVKSCALATRADLSAAASVEARSKRKRGAR